MSNASDFIIENGVLTKYEGKDTEVVIPEGVTEIGYGAFCFCKSVKSVTIPESVTSIGESVFYGCTSLANITLSKSLTSIGTQAFYQCKSLNNISIPDGVTFIGSSAFSYCHKLENITIPNSVTKIGDRAFLSCTLLANITIPESVKIIGEKAIEKCTNLKCIKVESAVAFDSLWDGSGPESKVRLLNAILKNDEIPSFVIPKIKIKKQDLMRISITESDENTIAKIFSLYKKIPLDELEGYIANAGDCVSVKAFLIDYKNHHYTVDKQKQIEEWKIEKELGLRERTVTDWKKIFSFEKCDGGIFIKGYKGNDLNVVIPEMIGKNKVVYIGERAFSYSSFITSISIPEGLTKIGDGAFVGCPNVTIHAPAGSYAETYAKENNIPFVAE